LDEVIGLSRGEDADGWTVLHLRPQAPAVGALEPMDYLHGGALATCADTAAWEAVVATEDGSWVVSTLRMDFLRLARDEPHLVRARARRLGRRLAVSDVEIVAERDPDRVVALGRASLTRTD